MRLAPRHSANCAPDIWIGHVLDVLPIRVHDDALLAVLLGEVDDLLRAVVRLLRLEVLGDRGLVLGRRALENRDRLECPRRLRPEERDCEVSAASRASDVLEPRVCTKLAT